MKTGITAPMCRWNNANIKLVNITDLLSPYFILNVFNKNPLKKISSDIGAINIATIQNKKNDLLKYSGIESPEFGGVNQCILK